MTHDEALQTIDTAHAIATLQTSIDVIATSLDTALRPGLPAKARNDALRRAQAEFVAFAGAVMKELQADLDRRAAAHG
jgi:hypothetical protein